MSRPFAHLFALVMAVITGVLPAVAGTAKTSEANTGENIFSCPSDAGTTPAFTGQRNEPGAKLRQMLIGNTKDDIPDFKQVQQLPTLTMAQRRQLRESFKGNKTEVQLILTKLKALKEKRDTAGGASPELRQDFESLRSRLQEIRRNSWEEMKTQLTPQQIADIQAMRRGELQPSTFREQTPIDAMKMMYDPENKARKPQ